MPNVTSHIGLPVGYAVFAFVTAPVMAADYYVSTTGSDSSAGTLGAPWRTLGKAASTASAGDTVSVRGGEYFERVTLTRSGSAGERIVFRNFPGEVPVLDGSGQGVGGSTAMVRIDGADFVTVEGFELRDLATSNANSTPAGIVVTGVAVGVEIASCHIHHIENNHAGGDGNAHGILVSGDRSTAIGGLLIRDCVLEDLKLGNSEALVLNGNVDGFEVRGNIVRRCNNIGIDFIGFEGTGPSAALDQARNGVCADNLVHDCSSRFNPAYNAFSAGGIYVDGGRDIVIERNRVYRCDIGVEIAAEAPGRATSGITVRDNILWRNSIGGIFTGSYDTGRGSTEDCAIIGNTCYQNDSQQDGNGELYIRYKTYGLEVCNNTFVANGQNLIVASISSDVSDISSDYNLFYAPSGGEFQWNGGSWFSGFGNWKSRTGLDAHSQFANPGFLLTSGDIGGFDFRIGASSPAYNSGDPSFAAVAQQTDAYGNPRIAAGRVDAGAYELPSVSAHEQWRLDYFGTSEGVGAAADLADPDADRLTNLEEFAYGTDPTVSSVGLLAPTGAGGLSFERAAAAAGEVVYTVQSSESLSAGSWIPIASRPAGGDWSSSAGVSVADDGKVVGVTDSRPAAARRFYRVEVAH